MNILLLTDFSDCSWNATKYALNFFEKSKCHFYLLHVCKLNGISGTDYPFLPSEETLEKQYLNPAKSKLRQVLKRISSEFAHNSNHKFYVLADYAFFVETIRMHVRDKRIDMIVMGARGISGKINHIWGSKTKEVITKVKCNSLIVPIEATYKHPEEIAFATDFILSYTIKTLTPISNLLAVTKASLRILHVIGNGEGLNLNQQTNKDLLADFFNGFHYSFHFLKNEKVEEAIQHFTEARAVDMVVMVAKNLNYFQQILFHSRVEKVTYHTQTPFLVLHEDL